MENLHVIPLRRAHGHKLQGIRRRCHGLWTLSKIRRLWGHPDLPLRKIYARVHRYPVPTCRHRRRQIMRQVFSRLRYCLVSTVPRTRIIVRAAVPRCLWIALNAWCHFNLLVRGRTTSCRPKARRSRHPMVGNFRSQLWRPAEAPATQRAVVLNPK